MKILAVSDEESQRYYEYFRPGMLDAFDLIIACGDLRRAYLEFLVTMARCPLLYVHGNHDDRLDADPPEGCVCIDDRLYVHHGIRIVGLGGSYRYREGKWMLTEFQMKRRIWKLLPKIWRHDGFDILVTHSPARHLNDLESLAHRGFECFLPLLRRYEPRFFIHGHIHRSYGIHIPQTCVFGKTTVINACDSCVVEI